MPRVLHKLPLTVSQFIGFCGILLSALAAHSESSLAWTYSGSQAYLDNTIAVDFAAADFNELSHGWTYQVNFITDQGQTPVAFSSSLQSSNSSGGVYIPAQNTSLNYELLQLNVTLLSPQNWLMGLIGGSALQTGVGTPDTQVYSIGAQFGRRYYLSKIEDQDIENIFTPSLTSQVKLIYNNLKSKAFTSIVNNQDLLGNISSTTSATIPASSIDFTSVDFAVDYQVLRWLNFGLSAKYCFYDADPSQFNFLRSPNAENVTDLEQREFQASLGFEISEHWLSELKYINALTAASGSFTINEFGAALYFAPESWEFGLGGTQIQAAGLPSINELMTSIKVIF